MALPTPKRSIGDAAGTDKETIFNPAVIFTRYE
jgi:hypothetical protein